MLLQRDAVCLNPGLEVFERAEAWPVLASPDFLVDASSMAEPDSKPEIWDKGLKGASRSFSVLLRS